jgi:hypothetical protein
LTACTDDADADVDNNFTETFLCETAVPVANAWIAYKNKRMEDAIHWASHISADDWRLACVNWLNRRKV